MNSWDVKRKAADRERKRLVEDRDKRMKGDRRTQHVLNAIRKRTRRVIDGGPSGRR